MAFRAQAFAVVGGVGRVDLGNILLLAQEGDLKVYDAK
jgi:hypothetical protein